MGWGPAEHGSNSDTRWQSWPGMRAGAWHVTCDEGFGIGATAVGQKAVPEGLGAEDTVAGRFFLPCPGSQDLAGCRERRRHVPETGCGRNHETL